MQTVVEALIYAAAREFLHAGTANFWPSATLCAAHDVMVDYYIMLAHNS